MKVIQKYVPYELDNFFCLIDSIRIMSNCVFNYNLYFNYGSTYILRIIRGYRIASKHTFKVISGIIVID